MYIHLGRDYVLNDRDIIGIFNMETTTITPRGREFLNYAQKNGGGVKFAENGRKTHRKRGMGKPRNCPESRTAPAGTPSAAGE